MKAVLCFVKESMYLPERVEEEAAAEVDAEAEASMPFAFEGVAACVLADFFGVAVLLDGLVPFGRADVDAFAEATLDTAMLTTVTRRVA